MNKLSIVYPVHNQFPLSKLAIETTIKNLSGRCDVEVIILDNASRTPFTVFEGISRTPYRIPIATHNNALVEPKLGDSTEQKYAEVITVHYSKNMGVYPTFWAGLKHSTGDVVAYFHSDLIVFEPNWDLRVMDRFARDDKLGMIGFIGSNEIDECGGRGLGTCSNFQGVAYPSENGDSMWLGSPAEAHGMRLTGFQDAAVVDGCSMIFRRSVLEEIPRRKDFPPHHFYDRLLSCEVRERGSRMGVLGVKCDHISGQTVNQESSYQVMAREWLEEHKVWYEAGKEDSAIYNAAEQMWLKEYRAIKKLVPCRVCPRLQ